MPPRSLGRGGDSCRDVRCACARGSGGHRLKSVPTQHAAVPQLECQRRPSRRDGSQLYAKYSRERTRAHNSLKGEYLSLKDKLRSHEISIVAHEEEIEKLLPQEGLIEFGCNPNKSAAM